MRQTIRPCQARKILGIGRATFEKWISQGQIKVAKRLPGTNSKGIMGERRFYLEEIMELEKRMHGQQG